MKVCLACLTRFEAPDWRCPECGHLPLRARDRIVFAPELSAGDTGFRSGYFSDLWELEAGNFWFRARNRLLVWTIRKCFPRARTFLEIGCGTGYVLSAIRQSFPELSVSGSEILQAGLEFAAQRVPGAALFQMDARRIPFHNEFDVIGAFDVLEHIEADEAVLEQMYQAVTPSGGILLTVPQHRFLWSAIDEYSCHIRRYTRKELLAKIARAGFRVVFVTSFMTLLLPAMVVSRRRQRAAEASFDPLAEFKIRPALNSLLERATDLERTMIRCGLTLPAGGSLLAAAVRT